MNLRDSENQTTRVTWKKPCCAATAACMQILQDMYLVSGKSQLTVADDLYSASTKLPDRKKLTFQFEHSSELDAFATQSGNRAVVTVSCALTRWLWVLTMSIWLHPVMRPLIEPKQRIRKNTKSIVTALPDGFDFPNYLDLEGKSNAEEIYSEGNPWFQKSLKELEESPVLMDACQRTFKTALQWLCLHEIGHVRLGHTSLQAVSSSIKRNAIHAMWPAATLSKSKQRKSVIPLLTQEEYCFLETEADEYANTRLATMLVKQMVRHADATQLFSRLAGMVLCPIAFHGFGILTVNQQHSACHPPLWFRVQDVFLSLRRAFTGVNISVDDSLQLANLCISSISSIHPFFGELLTHAKDSEANDPGDWYRLQLEAKATGVSEQLKSLKKT